METADFSKHTDEELREGIRKAEEQADRVAAEDSDEALKANQTQLEAMREELARRES
jgi:hypothetical protein